MASQLPRVRPGDPIRAATFNALVDAVNGLLGLTTAFPLEVQKTRGGIHLRIARLPMLRYVVLHEDVQPRQFDKPAGILDYDPGTTAWIDTTEESGYSDQAIDGFIDPADAGVYLQEERHPVLLEPESGRYIPLTPSGPHLAKADGNIDHSATGSVRIQRVDSEGEETDAAITLSARNWLLPRVWDGAPCQIELHPQSRVWYVTRAFSATRLRGKLIGSLGSTDATATVDNLIPLDGHYPIDSPSTSVTAQNIHAWEADSGADVVVQWNDFDSQWEMVQVTCPA